MARSSSSGASKTGAEPAKRPFAKAVSPVAIMDNYKRVTSADVIGRLKGLARGWDSELEGMLSVPKQLYASTGGSSQYYSSDANFSISNILMSLAMGASPDVSGMSYGLGLHERAGTVYFVLADPERRIIVRQRILCYHNTPPELDWGAVKGAIRSAEAGASTEDAKKDGLIAIFDGSLRFAGPAVPVAPVIGRAYVPPAEKK